MLHKPGVTDTLSHFVIGTRWDDVPQDVRHEAKRALLNFFAVALAGCQTAPVEIALRSLQEFSGREQATVIGRTERVDALSAAFLGIGEPDEPIAPVTVSYTHLTLPTICSV